MNKLTETVKHATKTVKEAISDGLHKITHGKAPKMPERFETGGSTAQERADWLEQNSPPKE